MLLQESLLRMYMHYIKPSAAVSCLHGPIIQMQVGHATQYIACAYRHCLTGLSNIVSALYIYCIYIYIDIKTIYIRTYIYIYTHTVCVRTYIDGQNVTSVKLQALHNSQLPSCYF